MSHLSCPLFREGPASPDYWVWAKKFVHYFLVDALAAAGSGDWRFIDSGPAAGDRQMALDECLTRGGLDRVTLRCYAWAPPALSLGYGQAAAMVAWEACQAAGIDVVRRPTGGRAVFHAEEVTYAVCIPGAHPLYGRTNQEIYHLIGRGLVAGLQRLGIGAALARSHPVPLPGRSPLCFSTTGRFEVTVGGRKLVGSAQRRWRDGLLQHGSILLGPRHLDAALFFQGAEAPMRGPGLAELTTTIREMAGRAISYDEVVSGLHEGFEAALGVTLRPAPVPDGIAARATATRGAHAVRPPAAMGVL